MNLGLIKTAGLITKTTKYGDSSLIVTIITKDLGKISAIANNVRTSKSRMLSGLQLFVYSEFVVYKGKGKKGLYNINEITVAEAFPDIRTSLEKLAYASYFAEIANCVSTENSPDVDILRLLLNSLFVLDRGLQPYEKIKTVFEWRLAHICGYSPLIEHCGNCQCSDSLCGISLSDGTALCQNCLPASPSSVKLSEPMLKIIEYISNSDDKKLFSFDAKRSVINYLSRVSELYIKTQLDQDFSTLSYLKNVTSMEDKNEK